MHIGWITKKNNTKEYCHIIISHTSSRCEWVWSESYKRILDSCFIYLEANFSSWYGVHWAGRMLFEGPVTSYVLASCLPSFHHTITNLSQKLTLIHVLSHMLLFWLWNRDCEFLKYLCKIGLFLCALYLYI